MAFRGIKENFMPIYGEDSYENCLVELQMQCKTC